MLDVIAICRSMTIFHQKELLVSIHPSPSLISLVY